MGYINPLWDIKSTKGHNSSMGYTSPLWDTKILYGTQSSLRDTYSSMGYMSPVWDTKIHNVTQKCTKGRNKPLRVKIKNSSLGKKFYRKN